MLDLYLIRHAESAMNKASNLIGGRSNESPLSEQGNHQANLLAERLLKERVQFSKIYSSTAKRTYQTAKAVAVQIGYPVKTIVQVDDLLELDQGGWEGLPRVECYTPEIISLINADPWNYAAPNGESQRQVEGRMVRWLDRELIQVSRNEDESVGIFTHGMAIKCLLRGIMNFDAERTYKVCIDNTSITRLKYTDRGWHWLTLNDAAHLLGVGRIEDRYSN